MKGRNKYIAGIFTLLCCLTATYSLHAQPPSELTLESAVEIAMANSYRIKQLQLGIEQTRFSLKSRQAGLKSRVYMNLKAPTFNYLTENKWNSELQKDESVKQNTGLWQMELSVRQPVILLGYPTNGYLSLNNKMYRYTQKVDQIRDLSLYNRYFVKFEQPLFRPNTLKNDIEAGVLDLQENELEYLDNQVNLIESIGYDYYNLFQLSYRNTMYTDQAANLQRAAEITRQFATLDTNRATEPIQIQVELANVNERLLANQGSLRLALARIKQRLRLSSEDSIFVSPTVQITPITVDLNRAVEYGWTLRPRLQLLSINKRKNEIYLQSAIGHDAFYMNLEMTYGLEKQDIEYRKLWKNHDNSYSVSVDAYIPIWDWGHRKNNIEASKINLIKSDLYTEEARNEIKSEIANAVDNLEEFQRRTLSMKQNLDVSRELTAMTLKQYRDKRTTLQDLFQVITRQRDTESNFLDAYLGYRRALLSLMVETFYDYENQTPLLTRFQPMSAEREN